MMEIVKCIVDILGLIFLLLGILVFILEIIGVIKYKYLLNRMHAAGMGDTFGIFSCLLGLILLNGIDFIAAKLFLVIIFLWFASPTASHLIARLEAATNEELTRHLELQVDEEDLEG